MTTADYLESLQNDLETIVSTLELEEGTNFTDIANMVENGEIIKSGGGQTLRNLEVGDNLLNKTIYFTFPETQDFSNSLSNFVGNNAVSFGMIYSQQGYMDTLHIRTLSNNRIALRDDSGVIYYNTVYENSTRNVDDLTLAFPLGDITNGDFTISAINTNNPAYQYIWVDANEMGD